MPNIKLTNVTKRWGKFYGVDNLTLDIEDNSFITLLGPSGCGKTTTLRMIAGLETPTSGKITIGDKVVFDSEQGINVPANKRRVGFLFQNYALWPNMTVHQNIEFGLSNVKEEFPTYDFDVKNSTRLIEILKKPKEVANLILESKDKTGKIDENRAVLALIDNYAISTTTAKTLYDYNLYKEDDVVSKSKAISEDLTKRVQDMRSKYTSKGQDLNEDFALVENGKVVLKNRKLTKEEIDLSVRRVARIVKIGPFMDRYPSELSGGQQQRVAIARTLAPEPTVLFMDEPLSNLDAKLRLEMRYELQRLHVETGSTFVYVTHDQMEAMTLATKICLINNGMLYQYAAPLEVYNKPKNLFVADFVGNPAINFIEAKGGQVGDGSLEFSILDEINLTFNPTGEINIAEWFIRRNEADKLDLEAKDALSKSKAVEKSNKDELFKYHIAKVDNYKFGMEEERIITDADFVLGVRPEHITITENGAIDGIIYGAMPTGMESTVKIRVGEYLLTAVIFGSVIYKIGTPVKIDITSGDINLFDQRSGKYITSGSVEIKK